MGSGRAPGGRKNAGRKKGVPNKRTLEIAERLEKLGCDPIEGMARIAMNPRARLDLRGRMYAELAQYVAPKRKAIEHSGPDGGRIEVEIMQLLQAGRERLQRAE